MNYFKIKNWNEFQHYKDRNPPWIKLHNQLLDNYEFECLTDATKGHLLCIWMLASRTNNKIPFDPAWVKRKIGANSNVDLESLLNAGFIELQNAEHNASKVLVSEEERRDREETEKRRENLLSPKAPVFNFKKSLIEFGCDDLLVSDWLKVRAKKKAANTETAFKKIIKEIHKSGLSVSEAIRIATENSWSGFKAEWCASSSNQPRQYSDAAMQTINNIKDL